MLQLTIEAILDFAGPRTGHFRLIESEMSSHDAYGTPRQLFVTFFVVIAATLREILGAEWTAEIDAAWRQLLDEIERTVSQHASQLEPRPRDGGSSGANVPIVRHCLHPRRAQSTPAFPLSTWIR